MKLKFYKTISVLAIVALCACSNSAWPQGDFCLRPPSNAERKSPFIIEGTEKKQDGAFRLMKMRFIRGPRTAKGYVVMMKPEMLEASVWVDPEMASYDFSKFAATDTLVADKKSKGQQVAKKSLPGKTVPLFFEDALNGPDGIDIAMAATQGGFWGDNTFVIIDGRLIKKEVPGLYPPSYPAAYQPVTGEFFFFVVDEGKVGIRRVYIGNGQAMDDISDIRCAFCGPPMLLDGVDVSGNITYIKDADGNPAPLRAAYHVNWEPSTLVSQFSAWGRGPKGEIVYMGFVGNPEKPQEQPGVYCTELVELARELGIKELILGPGSVDVNVCVSGEGHILESLPGPGSETAKAFPNGRPLGTIFWARAKKADGAAARQLLEAVAPKILKQFYGDNEPVARHVLRVTRSSLLIAERMGVPYEGQRLLIYAGLLHDIGYFKQPALGKWFELGNKYGFSRPMEELYTDLAAFCEKYNCPVLEKLKKQYPPNMLPSVIEENMNLIVAEKIKEVSAQDGEDISLLEPVEESLEKAFRHAEYSAKMLKSCPPEVLSEVGISMDILPLILPIVQYHSHPYRMPIGTADSTRALTEILVAADSFESANNRERGKNYYNRRQETLPDAFTWLETKVKQKDTCQEAVEAIKDLLISNNQEVMSIILEAREAWVLPSDDLAFIGDLKTIKLGTTGVGIDGKEYGILPADQTNRAESDKRIEHLRQAIEERVSARGGKVVTGQEAVAEAEWLLNWVYDPDNPYRSNCSDPEFKANMPAHMKEMPGIVRRLNPRASPELLIAAMLHDSDRFYDGYYVMIEDEPPTGSDHYRRYYKPIQHPNMSADFITPRLRLLGIDEGITQRVDTLIRNHETGVSAEMADRELARDSGFLRDADSISTFTPVITVNSLVDYRNKGRENEFYHEVLQKYTRAGFQARAVIDGLMQERQAELLAFPYGQQCYDTYLRVREECAGPVLAGLRNIRIYPDATAAGAGVNEQRPLDTYVRDEAGGLWRLMILLADALKAREGNVDMEIFAEDIIAMIPKNFGSMKGPHGISYSASVARDAERALEAINKAEDLSQLSAQLPLGVAEGLNNKCDIYTVVTGTLKFRNETVKIAALEAMVLPGYADLIQGILSQI